MGRRRKISDAEIVGVARRLFLEQGLQLSTRALADEMGISEGVIFQRFNSKANLIAAALAFPAFDAERLVNEAGAAGKDARETLENIAILIYHQFCKLLPLSIPQLTHPEYKQELVFSSHKSPFQTLTVALEAHLKLERQKGRIRTESPHITAYFIVSALHNQAFLEAIPGSSTERNEGNVRDWIGVLWQGLEPR